MSAPQQPTDTETADHLRGRAEPERPVAPTPADLPDADAASDDAVVEPVDARGRGA